MLVKWDIAKAESTSQVWDQEYQDENTTTILESVIQKDASQN